ncbi:MAG TPA: FAD-binding protein, partial [Xanthomonadaceae bacterium]|nr:FAD-binding protein [Xanthomonadaceae bacterium]
DKSGFHILHTLFQTSLQFPAIVRYDEYFATGLVVDEGRCRGFTAIEMRSGQLRLFQAGAVIIASGGAGRMFPFTTNGAIKTGDGMALAYRAGVPLKDMEFVQYHPTGLPNTGTLLTEACRGEGGILLNRHGRRFLQDYGMGPETPVGQPVLKTMELGPRDRVSQAFWHEQKKGNMVPTQWGDCMLMDMRHLGEKTIDERLPLVRDMAVSYLGVDPVSDPVPVRPVVHYMMGGIDTDITGATPLPGLFAAGECACVSINGANRLGSNSLTELLVFGRRAALSAAQYLEQGVPDADAAALVAHADAAQARLRELFQRSGGGETLAGLRREMMAVMEAHAGIYRSGEGLTEACAVLSQLRGRYGAIELHDKTNVYNTDLLQALELGSMLDCAEAVAVSALARTESRGAHQRLDFTERDDRNFLRHSLATFGGSQAPSVAWRDVVITRSPPGVRDYSGGQA